MVSNKETKETSWFPLVWLTSVLFEIKTHFNTTSTLTPSPGSCTRFVLTGRPGRRRENASPTTDGSTSATRNADHQISIKVVATRIKNESEFIKIKINFLTETVVFKVISGRALLLSFQLVDFLDST